MHVVVGLGNPGREYTGTRHNVGYDVVDRLAIRFGFVARAGDFDRLARARFDGLAMDGPVGAAAAAGKLLLLKPTTYMNLSGRSVQQALAFHRLTPADAMVVVDDVALPVGKLRIRGAGSAGGHNGLRDVERALGTTDYPRLRIGVDAPPPRVPQRDWVLGRFPDARRPEVDDAIGRAADAVATWIESGINAAMNRFNAEDSGKRTGDRS